MKKILLVLIGVLTLTFLSGGRASAADCRDIEFVFARGSGAERNASAEWRQYKSAMAKVARRRGYSYRVTDLDYPAVTVANPLNALGAKIGAGKAFAFGRSVSAGTTKLKDYYKKTVKNCTDTKWVLGGYSQGALVVAQAVESFSAARVVYMGLFGDPWTYLPEGKGALPKACFGFGLSDYRVYAPNCATHKGTLGGRDPYVSAGLSGKVGLWCNKEDYICGSSRRLTKNSGHVQYAEKNELIWMADKVEKKLSPRYSSDTSVLASTDGAEDDVEDVIEAHFSSDEYHVGLNGNITFDASGSFSFGHEIVEYLWSVNGGEFYSTGTESAITRMVEFPNRAIVTVRIVDDIGRTAEATVLGVALEGVFDDDTMPAPRNVTAECVNDEIRVSWTESRPGRAKYILIRLNDVDLDYVPVDELSATINEIQNTANISSIKVAWLDSSLELGEWGEVELVCAEPVNLEPVETGVNYVSFALLAGGFIAMMAICIYKKYLPR